MLGHRAVLDLVAKHATLARAADELRDSQPLADRSALNRLWARVEELLAFLDDGRELPLSNIVDLVALIGEEREAGGVLGAAELAAVGAAAANLAEFLQALHRHHKELPLAHTTGRKLHNPEALAQHLASALEPDGYIKDGASPKLAGLWDAVRAREQALRKVARTELSRAVERGVTRGGELVMRGDRFCIPLRSGERSAVQGLIHDRSATGQTLFIEPLAVVEAGNQFSEARLAVAEEERRILAALNHAVGERREELLELFLVAVQVDGHRARARYGLSVDGVRPQLHEGRGVQLSGFRHPLLVESLRLAGRERELVPLTVKLGEDDSILLISGPNAGGKTVALKSLGVAAIMAQSGIPLPASGPCRLPVYEELRVELGDEQSIEDALSSFSAHLTHLRAILEEAGPHSLLLLDELGSGTDPQEGVAFARAILEELSRRGSRTLATTHYGQLKVLVEESQGFRNASMAYDHERLLPQFRLVLDRPGSSHALEIAQRIGLPETVLERARELVGDEGMKLESLLRALEEDRRVAGELRAEAERQEEGARNARREHEDRARDLRKGRRERLVAAEREAEGIVRNARKEVERLLARLRSTGGGEEALEAARLAREAIEGRLEKLEAKQEEHRPRYAVQRPSLEVGGAVRHRQLGQVGTIVEIRGERVTLDIAGRRVRATVDQLEKPAQGEQPRQSPGGRGGVQIDLGDSPTTRLTPEIDVRGEDGAEAWGHVDGALDRLLLGDGRELQIIHGKGTGHLRRMLAKRLAEDPRVESAQVGGGGRFDDGVTVARLRG